MLNFGIPERRISLFKIQISSALQLRQDNGIYADDIRIFFSLLDPLGINNE